ncbi:MAG: HAMP domain-containing sensor histidine kinase [Peptostreptococcaceae bacterium]|nr:HAMP domain-containing sensor histidine kinase [Peptostreptococcaceae bacterium]
MKITKLKSNLLLIPSIMILISFGIILIIFNMAIQHYIEGITAKRMTEMFSYFDDYFNDPMDLAYSDQMDDELIVSVYHILLDDREQVLYPGPPWYSNLEMERTLSIERYVRDDPSVIRSANAIKISIEQGTYYVKSKTYRGGFDGYFVTKDAPQPKNYTLLLFSNITPIQNFLDLLNEVLILLMFSFGILSVLAIFGMAKKIDRSLCRLKQHLLAIGNREPLQVSDSFAYEEFNELSSTMQAMAKMLDRAEESQQQFFQNASHELRTPLMSIQGYAEGIHSGVIKDEIKACEIIIKESQKMSELVDEILFLSKMDHGSQQDRERLVLQDLLYDCSATIQSIAERKGIEIAHHLPSEKVFVSGDEKLLERAFSNLLSNALRYARSRIEIRCETDERSATVRILDDGPGITPEDLPHIFERFYKGRNGKFGIGLSITREIVKEHGGMISASCADGSTDFKIVLPLDGYDPIF